LNEKVRGSISGSEVPSNGHAKRCEKTRSSFSLMLARSTPSPSRSAVSTESVMRTLASSSPGPITRRSTTISIECFFILSRVTFSERS
jgi:hypothetical protein